MPATLPRRAVRRARRIVSGRRRTRVRPDSPFRAAERVLSPCYPDHLVAEPDDDEPDDVGAEAPDGGDDGREPLPAIRVAGVLTPSTARRLGDVIAVAVLAPGSRALGARVGAGDLLVVERAALQSGPWSTAETSSGTALLLEVLDWCAEARELGVPVVLLDSGDPPNVGTNLLKDAADMVLPRRQEADPVLGPVPMSPTVSLLDGIARAEEER